MDALKTAIQEAARLKRDEGIIRLNSCFQWREFEGDDQRQKIHQEFVYENVMYSVQRGLPWAAVAQIANLSKELLPELRGLERSEAASLIQTRLSQCVHRLSPSHHATMYDFMVQTYIHHQSLYQAFLKEEVNLNCMHSHLEIQVPPHPLPLSEGTDLGIWEKQQALKELMAVETVKLAEIHRLKEQAEAQIWEKAEVSLSDLSLEGRLDKQALESMVHSILQSEVDMLKEILIKEIRAVQELLEIRLSQTALQGAGHSSDASGFSQKGSTSGSTKPKKK
ncbi:uncharacterized protein C8orf74 homolog [Ictalurus punctatus]|uniref:Uncharacterized protein C8orf74 homolog n=1 Tax=Ictalurus punctatus TaxID=7998 RepID=A0A2D0RQ99_ICTPU|nr:uncharacterized protein C8orf74 homolog [Ictalurus punctatus]